METVHYFKLRSSKSLSVRGKTGKQGLYRFVKDVAMPVSIPDDVKAFRTMSSMLSECDSKGNNIFVDPNGNVTYVKHAGITPLSRKVFSPKKEPVKNTVTVKKIDSLDTETISTEVSEENPLITENLEPASKSTIRPKRKNPKRTLSKQ